MVDRAVRDRSEAASRLALASFALALAASLVLLLAPLGSSFEAVLVGAGSAPVRVTHESLLQHDGWSVAVPLSVPVGIAGAAFLVGRGRRRRPVRAVAAFLLTAFVVVGILSIGIYYVPAAGAMFAAAASGLSAKATR
jgi:hypothetical protein